MRTQETPVLSSPSDAEQARTVHAHKVMMADALNQYEVFTPPKRDEAWRTAARNLGRYALVRPDVAERFRAVNTDPVVEEFMQTYDDYQDALDKDQRSLLEKRVEFVAAYEPFKASIDALRAAVDAEGDNYPLLPEFVAEGMYSRVFRLETADGDAYAVRFPNEEHLINEVNFHLDAAIVANGTRGADELVAVSYEDNVVISEFIEGKTVNDLTFKEAAAITDEQLNQLLDTTIELADKDIWIDAHGNNIILTPEGEFHVIDYHWGGGEIDHEVPEVQAVELLVYNGTPTPETQKTEMLLLGKMKRVIESRTDLEDPAAALSVLDEEIFLTATLLVDSEA